MKTMKVIGEAKYKIFKIIYYYHLKNIVHNK